MIDPNNSNGPDEAGATSEATEAPSPQVLVAFNGGPAPAVILSAWESYCGFDELARRELPSLLHGVLEGPEDPANNGRFKAFCGHFGISSDVLGGVVQGLNQLIGQASALGLEPDALHQDLLSLGSSLHSNPSSIAEPIVQLYTVVQPRLRARLVDETLAEHGRLLIGVDWRVDELKISDRGVGLDTSVMHLTLRYREGDETSRVSFQLVPEMARRLRDVCSRVVG